MNMAAGGGGGGCGPPAGPGPGPGLGPEKGPPPPFAIIDGGRGPPPPPPPPLFPASPRGLGTHGAMPIPMGPKLGTPAAPPGVKGGYAWYDPRGLWRGALMRRSYACARGEWRRKRGVVAVTAAATATPRAGVVATATEAAPEISILPGVVAATATATDAPSRSSPSTSASAAPFLEGVEFGLGRSSSSRPLKPSPPLPFADAQSGRGGGGGVLLAGGMGGRPGCPCAGAGVGPSTTPYSFRRPSRSSDGGPAPVRPSGDDRGWRVSLLLGFNGRGAPDALLPGRLPPLLLLLLPALLPLRRRCRCCCGLERRSL
mmetsp:Transcript_41452/g.125518  ORF Transcript_41452/g.125518 Transcript_41452/m.125518 type:complete len:315 (+) Transcript_41452:1171-2115(+)